MRGRFQLPLFFAFFIIFSIGYVRPASAIYTCDQCVVSAIVGPGGVYTGPFKSMIPGETEGADEEPMAVSPPTSLVDYFEKVWWPRMVELTKAQQGAADKTSTLLSSMGARTAEAQQIAQYQQDTKRMNLETQMNAVGRTETLCPEPSMGQSSLALQFMAIQALNNLERLSAREMAGDKSLPAYARGKLENDKARVKERIDMQLCTKDGADGAASEYCTATKPELENADQLASSALGSYVYDDSEQPESPHNVNLVKRYVDNVFSSRIFEPLPVSITKQESLPPDAVQVIADQNTLAARTTMFQHPFMEQQADRSPVNGEVKALDSLEAAINRAGYDGPAKQMILNSKGKVSRASEEYIRFKIYESDPKSMSVDLADVGKFSVSNLMVVSIQKQMKEMTLLYDIREQIKQTNLLLGALGAVLIEPQYQDLRERIQTLQSDGSRGE